MKGLFAEIAVFSALEQTLHYVVPEDLSDSVQPGMRVLVPLGRRESTGLVVGLTAERPDLPDRVALRSLLAVLDARPVLPPDLLDICRWISKYYFYPLGEVLQTALPPGLGDAPGTFYRLTPAGSEKPSGPDDEPLLPLFTRTGKVSLEECIAAFPTASGARKHLRVLERAGLIERVFEWKTPQPHARITRTAVLIGRPAETRMKKSADLRRFMEMLEESGGRCGLSELRREVGNAGYWLKKLEEEGLLRIDAEEELREFSCAQCLPEAAPPELTPAQRDVLEAVLPCIERPRFVPFLLHGVTGSGKTEIYLRLIQAALDRNGGSLVLVPEIALSTQMEALFRQRFGRLVAIWHSGLPPGPRFDQWREILNGRKPVVLGVRSAVFMPVSRPALIIVDEEHDSSYKQDDRLRYHARDVAIMRARALGIPVVLGSATPSLQSTHHAQHGRYQVLSLPKRILDRPLPTIEVVNMNRESSRARILSHALQQALRETLEQGRQALLFLNRRGFATFILCGSCGHVLQCDYCSVSLTYHNGENLLRCHYCGWERDVPASCPACGRSPLLRHGVGTERLEAEAALAAPGARIVRIDRDTVAGPKDMVRHLDAVRHARADILIGTQMVAKGHDFPNITLVGVINADTALQLPDYRSGEITVQLLIQVAGRAGRGDSPGRVILQTYNPAHYTIQSVSDMDYAGFCDKELESREQLQYPPFARFLRLLVTAREENTAREAAGQLAALSRETASELRESGCRAAVLGPSPAPLTRLKDRYRWHLFIKTWTNEEMQQFVETVLKRARDNPALRRVQLSVDRDPMANL
ncbi:MAG: primosomal protein N' [Desulfobacteraceae bacterium]|nr:primosomal protein N' [Desulfobacteraceae bacterium]